MKFRKITVLLAVFTLFAQTLSLNADENWGDIADFLNNIYGIDNNTGLTAFPVLNVPMGGRSEGMAGAFAAISDDISFLEFNPAGSSMLEKSELAFFHNNWVADTKLEGAAYATRFGNLGIAAGAKWLYTPFTEYNYYGERVSSGYYSEGVAILNVSYNLFPSYYFSGVSIGVNLKGAFRLVPDFTDNYDNILSGSGMDQSAAMGMADIGILTRFNFLKFYAAREQNMSVALVAKNLGPPASGEALPTVFNAAIAYKPIRPLIISFDFFYPFNLLDYTLSELPYGALGLSVQVADFLSMRTGLMVKAGTSRFTIGSAIIIDNITLDINYTLDLLTQFQPLNRISLGVRINLGDKGRKQLSDKVDELYLLGVEAHARGNLADAKLCWEEALSIDSGFTPAKEALIMMENREDLIKRIEDLYLLDF
ncbi:MAG: UPF0164 family protein [Treponema sp.]|jgi:hypothetical protein|nr:UPF0164 family protein [Treponema sp.]